MSGLTVFACFCSAGIAVCLTYIVLTVLAERKRNAEPKMRRPPKESYNYYEAYESGESLNMDVE